MGPHPDAVLAELTRLLTRICKHDQPGLSAETMLDEIPGIDSLRLLQVVAHLEERFDVEIDVSALDDLHRGYDIVNAISSARPAA
jgi:acyl carrier protein